MGRPTRAAARLAASRLQVEAQLDDLRRSVDRELGWVPKTRPWVLPLAAFAAGLALAGLVAARRKKDRRRRREAPPAGDGARLEAGARDG